MPVPVVPEIFIVLVIERVGATVILRHPRWHAAAFVLEPGSRPKVEECCAEGSVATTTRHEAHRVRNQREYGSDTTSRQRTPSCKPFADARLSWEFSVSRCRRRLIDHCPSFPSTKGRGHGGGRSIFRLCWSHSSTKQRRKSRHIRTVHRPEKTLQNFGRSSNSLVIIHCPRAEDTMATKRDFSHCQTVPVYSARVHVVLTHVNPDQCVVAFRKASMVLISPIQYVLVFKTPPTLVSSSKFW